MTDNRISRFLGTERRKYKRFPFVFPIKYMYLGSSTEAGRQPELSQYSFSNNISRSGMMLTITNNVPPGEMIDLVITLPVEHDVVTIHATGEVKWIRKEEDGYLSGIEFKTISENDLAVIQNLLKVQEF